MSCNQCKKVTWAEYDELFVCIYCKRQNVKTTTRCCVEVELEDASGSILATLFGKNAENMLSCSAKQLMEQTDEDGITDIESVATLSNPDNFLVHIKATTYERQGQTKNKFSVVAANEIPK
ncbi:hypothetical protein Dsin_006431 [Dipteronia sinensis]|uniref:Replication factor A C-terminal domain-containing protein n=1 Tax=Dipteronia sinensis TaxID=43782 RepID=A0AAE0EFV3_9ROSI|nr:hypothetical protein Dsin_006431 [Dipteronia sinensis]